MESTAPFSQSASTSTAQQQQDSVCYHMCLKREMMSSFKPQCNAERLQDIRATIGIGKLEVAAHNDKGAHCAAYVAHITAADSHLPTRLCGPK
jgi:hypothetical protein